MARTASILVLILLMSTTLIGCGDGSPQAKFSAIPLGGRPPLVVQFTDKSRGDISAWEWDFDGDGQIDSIAQSGNYTYETPGKYTISLTVRGPKGNHTETKQDYIEITRCPYLADFEVQQPLPSNCQVQGNITTCTGTSTIHFLDKSTGNVTEWAWDFDSNGSIDSSAQNPSHTFSRDGNYTVTLTITTPECRDTIAKLDYIYLSGCST